MGEGGAKPRPYRGRRAPTRGAPTRRGAGALRWGQGERTFHPAPGPRIGPHPTLCVGLSQGERRERPAPAPRLVLRPAQDERTFRPALQAPGLALTRRCASVSPGRGGNAPPLPPASSFDRLRTSGRSRPAHQAPGLPLTRRCASASPTGRGGSAPPLLPRLVLRRGSGRADVPSGPPASRNAPHPTLCVGLSQGERRERPAPTGGGGRPQGAPLHLAGRAPFDGAQDERTFRPAPRPRGLPLTRRCASASPSRGEAGACGQAQGDGSTGSP